MTDTRSLVASVKAVDDTGGWTAVASAPSVDRDDEVIEARAFEPLPASVPVRSAHFGGELVGSGRPYYVRERLHIDGRFASTSRAQEVRTLVKEGHLQTMSVVFLPLTDRRVAGRRHIVTGELLAVDWAEIASNRDTRVLAVRSLRQPATRDTSLVWKARIAAIEAELALLDLDVTPKPAPPLAGVYAELAKAQGFLATLDRQDRP